MSDIDEKVMPKIDLSEYSKDKYLIEMGDYEIKFDGNATYAVRKPSSYLPKTYKEACLVLGERASALNDHGYRADELCKLQKLLICRDACWEVLKWHPDFDNKYQERFCILNNITILESKVHHLLTFPSKDVCERFVENFGDLINECRIFV